MKKIFIDASEKYVGARVVFANSESHLLFVDSTFETLATAEEILNAFLAGNLVVVLGSDLIRPVSVSSDGESVDVNGTTYTVTEIEDGNT